MTRRTDLVALLALIAFLGCTAGATGLIPTSCCSSSGKACPGAACDSTAAKLLAKSDTILAVAPAPVPHVSLPVGAAVRVEPSDSRIALPPAFRRPMRN